MPPREKAEGNPQQSFLESSRSCRVPAVEKGSGNKEVALDTTHNFCEIGTHTFTYVLLSRFLSNQFLDDTQHSVDKFDHDSGTW